MGRKNTLTRFFEDIVDDDDDKQAPADVAALQASLAQLKAKVDELTALSAKTSAK